jgi:CBS domain-containing protein
LQFIKVRLIAKELLSGLVASMSQKLRKVMVEKVKTARFDETVQNIAMLMNRYQIGCVIIVDDGDKPLGIITERDMIKRVICKAVSPEDARIMDVMSKPLVTASPDMRAGDAAKIMLEHNIKKLPVVDEGRLVGLVTLTDLVRTEGVVEALNGYVLNGVPKRLKKTLATCFDDGIKQNTRRCPLLFSDGVSIGCQLGKCMWWTGDECAVTRISKQMDFTQANEEEEVKVVSEER